MPSGSTSVYGFSAIEPTTGERAFYFHQELAP